MAQIRQTRRMRRTRKTRRMRRTRRAHTQGGMNNAKSDHIRDLLRDLFPELDIKRFAITETEEYYQVNLIRCEEQARHSQRYSPRITIYKDGRMYIGRLTSCKPVSGGEIIRRYILLARQLGLHTIQLEDWSEVYFPSSRYGDDRCAIDFAILRILLKGESWYESLGFIAPNSEVEHAQNEKVRQMTIETFIQQLIEKERQATRDRILKRYELNNNISERNRKLKNAEEKQSDLEGLLDLFPEIDKATPVYRAIQQMIDHINKIENACESKPFHMLQKVINTCTITKDPLIHYQRENLTMTL